MISYGRTAILLSAAVACFASTPSWSQRGAVAAADFIATYAATCDNLGPNFTTKVPVEAKAKRWDELGSNPAAKARAWMIAVKGAPVLLDISARAPGEETCAVSAATSPASLEASLTKKFGRKPDKTDVSNQQIGTTIAFRYVKSWRVKKAGTTRTISLTTISGREQARLSVRYGG